MSELVKRRRKLNTEQLEVLELLYKFRFGSNNLFAQYFGKKSGAFMFKRLSILHEKGLVGRRFEPRHRLLGKPVAYYLTPAGARALQEHRDPDKPEIDIKAIYKDKTVKDDFMWRCLDVFAAYNRLRTEYGDRLKFFTRANLNYEKFDYFPQPLPDAYIRLRLGGEEKQYFLDFYYDTEPFFAPVKKIKKYIKYAESEDWDDTGTALPTFLAVCESTGLQKRLQKRIAATANESWDEDAVFATTTKAEILGDDSVIWHVAGDLDTKLLLQAIQ